VAGASLSAWSGDVIAARPGGPPGLDRAVLRAPHADDRVIVGFQPGAGPVARGAAVASVDSRGARRPSPLAGDTLVMRLSPGQSVAEAIVELSAQPGVAYAVPDYKLFPAALPDDGFYTGGSHWGMYGDATTPANSFGTGAGEAWATGHTGSAEVYVGVVDEGIQITHPDLEANIWTNPGELANGLDDDGNGYVDDIHGWDFHADDETVYDGSGDDHGTHVAGTIGARGGNGIGVAGVAWQVGLIPAKFMGPDFGLTSDAVEALDYLTALKLAGRADIVATNNSWGGGQASPPLLDAIERAGDAGILFVAAAGNDSSDLDSYPSYPASYRCDRKADGTARGWDCLISVANLDQSGGLNASSNRSTTSVDLGAPGTNIVSTVPSNGYSFYSGTSMAAPHVAGALALCASIDPALSPRQLRSLVMDTVMATPSLASTTATGGRLDVGTLAEACASVAPPAVSTSIDELEPRFERSGRGWRNAWFGKGGHHYWLLSRAGARQAWGTWQPRLEAPGRYRIEAWIPRRPDLSRRAGYRIRSSDGWITRRMSQARHAGRWLRLGVYDLAGSPLIRLTDATGEGGTAARRLVFDRLRLVPTTAPATVVTRGDRSETERPPGEADPGASPAPGEPASPVPDVSASSAPGEPRVEPSLDPVPADPEPGPTPTSVVPGSPDGSGEPPALPAVREVRDPPPSPASGHRAPEGAPSSAPAPGDAAS
jgi:subtilisin family serine protease